MCLNNKLCLALIAIATTSYSGATMLDDFTPIDANFELSYGPTQPAGSIVGVTNGSMVTGERDMEIVQTTSREPLIGASFGMSYRPHRWYNNERFFFIGGEGPGTGFTGEDSIFRLQYDFAGDEEDNLGLGKRLRNGGSGTAIFDAADGGIRMWTSGPESSRQIPTTIVLRRLGTVIGSFSQNMGETDLFVPYLFPFDPAVLGQADSMTIEFTINARGDSTPNLFISHIETIVPEGESGMAFAAGVSALALTGLRRRTAKQ